MATDYSTMPDEEFWAEYMAINSESGRRRTLEQAPAKQDELNEQVLAAEGIEDGDPWRQPTGGHDAYPTGAIVTHKGKTWESLTTANVWEPGVSGWREAGNEWPTWVQPTGAHDAYPKGAKVTHNAKHYTSNIAANVWAPPEQWTLVP